MEVIPESKAAPNNGMPTAEEAEVVNADDSIETNGLQWNSGIGTLPGSDLKFQKNKAGDIEVIMDAVKFEAPDIGSDHDHRNFVDRSARDSARVNAGEWRYQGDSHAERSGLFQHDQFVATDSFDQESVVSYDLPASAKHNSQVVLNPSDYATSSDKKIQSIEKRDTGFPKTETAPQSTVCSIMSNEKCHLAFDWDSYLELNKAIAAPASAFVDATGREPFPDEVMKFSVGDLLESVDPLHQSLVCAVSVVEVKGYRMRLHFEGYATLHDFWVNSDDKLLFPCGFCESTGRKLHPPKNHDPTTFNWSSYARASAKTLSGKEQFRDDISKCYERNTNFEIGDKLEAVDKSNLHLTCVATVSDIIDDRILIHFDGWNHNYDFWCDNNSNYIHAIGWCSAYNETLSVPQEYADDQFTWGEYLQVTNSRAATPSAFATRTSHQFEVGMGIEVVDKRNPILVRVASVADKNSYQIKVHFDGWDHLFDYWIDVDSPDLHPVKWCERTGHILQPNITEEEKKAWQGGCPVPGCRGIGHIKGSKFVGHHSEYGCPYSSKNLDSYPIQDRIMPRRGPKPSSLMSRRIATVNNTEREKINSFTPEEIGDRRRSVQRRTSRNMLYDEEKEDGALRGNNSSPHTTEPSSKKSRLNEQSKVEGATSTDGSNLRYSIPSATAWSSFPDKSKSQYWEKCSKYLPGVKGIRGSEISKWTSAEVSSFVTKLTGRGSYGQLFTNEEIDGEAFLLLSQNDISKVLNIKLGPTLKIHGAILYALTND